jgi:hypothetical protein
MGAPVLATHGSRGIIDHMNPAEDIYEGNSEAAGARGLHNSRARGGVPFAGSYVVPM